MSIYVLFQCRFEDMDKLCKAVGLPLYWKKPMFKCMTSHGDAPISVTDFTAYWRAMTSVAHDEAARYLECVMFYPTLILDLSIR